jgi:hypothetical protein
VRTSGGSISLVGNGIAYNEWCYEQVCVAPAANLLIARVTGWIGLINNKFLYEDGNSFK